MGTLNTICMDREFALEEAGELNAADPHGSAYHAAVRTTIPRERWTMRSSHKTKAERDTILGEFQQANGVGSILWTPPGEGSDRRVRFVRESFRDTVLTANDYAIEFTLQALPGIPV